MECSSKEMTGVEEIFAEAINTVVANDRSNQQEQTLSGSGGGSSQQAGMIKKKKKRNCRML